MCYDKIEIEHNKIKGINCNNKVYGMKKDIIKAKKLLSILSINRADNYLEWIDLGFCLHNIDYDLLYDWIEFSKNSSKYKEGECEKDWIKFDNEGLNIGSLYRWAKIDNIHLYTDFLLSEYDDIIKDSLDGSHASIAKVFYEFYKNDYVCTIPDKHSWYEFKNHRWVEILHPCSIFNKLNDEFVKIYIKLIIAYNQKALCVENNNEIVVAVVTNTCKNM